MGITLNKLIDEINNAQTIGIIGHSSPDGDCVGSCTAVYQYILDNYQGKKVQIYLQPFKEAFYFLILQKPLYTNGTKKSMIYVLPWIVVMIKDFRIFTNVSKMQKEPFV